MRFHDWTALSRGGNSCPNASKLYHDIVDDVEGIIRSSAQELINGDAHIVARQIVSRIAHYHHLMPPEAFQDEQRKAKS